MTKEEDNQNEIDAVRRRFLLRGLKGLGALGLGLIAWPLIQSWKPSKALLADNLVSCDLSALGASEQYILPWQGKPIWIFRRNQKELDFLDNQRAVLVDPDSHFSIQPPYAANAYRSRRPDIAVLVGVCTHLGCSPKFHPDKLEIDKTGRGEFLCPCHGSRFDLAGRVLKGMPAQTNLTVPPYYFSGDQLIIGQDGA